MANECRKSRNRLKIETFVFLAEYLKHQPDCNSYKRQNSKSKRSPSWMNQSYLPFFFKYMKTMLQSYQRKLS